MNQRELSATIGELLAIASSLSSAVNTASAVDGEMTVMVTPASLASVSSRLEARANALLQLVPETDIKLSEEETP